MTIPHFDLQINGCFGVDFNSDDLTVDQLRSVNEKLYTKGTRQYLATIITDNLSEMLKRIERLADAILTVRKDASNVPMAKCVGIHIEGPFISNEVGFVGAHPAQFAIKASAIAAKQLLNSAHGFLKLVTLAPERDAKGVVTQFFAENNVIVAAGHTNASLEELRTCVDNGLQMITHFGNACPSTLPRHDNILWRMLSLNSKLYAGIIADGHHLPLWMIPMLVKHFGQDHVICVSDAISAAGLGQGTYHLGSRQIEIGADLVARDVEHQHFVGSTSLLSDCEAKLRSLNAFSDSQLDRLLHKNALALLHKTSVLSA